MLINCVAYQDGKKLGDIPVDDIADYIAKSGCFVWVGLKDGTPEELKIMQDEFGLHELAVEDARNGHQRPKIEEYGNSLFVVIHTFELIENELVAGEVDIFVDHNYVLSVRNRSEQHFIAVRARCEREQVQLQQGPAFVMYALMDAIVDRYFPVVDALESELETIEENIFIGNGQRTNIERLYALKRKVTLLKHAVSPLMESVAKLHGGRVPPLCMNTQEYFRDIHDHLHRINTSIDSIRDTIGTAIQVCLSMVAIEDGHVHKRLAAWAAIFAVATVFVGVWGMNFKNMPELSWDYGYPVAIGIIGTVCGYLYYRLKRSGWL